MMPENDRKLAYPGKITECVYLVGNHYFRSYLVRGEICALIEAGVTWSALQVVSQLAELGIAPEELQYLVISHAHFDHVCGIPGLQKAFPHLRILASEPAAGVLGKAKVVAGFFNEDTALAKNLRGKEQTAQPASKAEPDPTMAVDLVIHEGGRLDLGRGTVLHFSLLPGHSPCSMAVYLPSQKVLFPADCAGYPIGEDTIFPMYFAGYEDYVAGLKKLQNMEASVLAAPHELLLSGKGEINRYFRRSLAATAQLHQSILEDYRTGKSRDDISRGLFQRFYRGGLANYSAGNIRVCTDLLVRRTLESARE
jgi:glyoxylase-like metal-dependent hydrolase (beta-lactamase superfamily II)